MLLFQIFRVPDHMEIFILLENKVCELVYEHGFCIICATHSDYEASQPSYQSFLFIKMKDMLIQKIWTPDKRKCAYQNPLT